MLSAVPSGRSVPDQQDDDDDRDRNPQHPKQNSSTHVVLQPGINAPNPELTLETLPLSETFHLRSFLLVGPRETRPGVFLPFDPVFAFEVPHAGWSPPTTRLEKQAFAWIVNQIALKGSESAR